MPNHPVPKRDNALQSYAPLFGNHAKSPGSKTEERYSKTIT